MFLRESDADLKTTKEYELDSERGRDRERERDSEKEREKNVHNEKSFTHANSKIGPLFLFTKGKS